MMAGPSAGRCSAPSMRQAHQPTTSGRRQHLGDHASEHHPHDRPRTVGCPVPTVPTSVTRDSAIASRCPTMSTHPSTGFDLDEVDRLMTTTKQVRKRLDLSRPVPIDELLECIEIAGHAPMGGNLERNRWLIVDDADLKARIAERFADVGRPYLAANSALRSRRPQPEGDRVGRVPRRAPRRGAGAGHRHAPRPASARPVDARRCGRRTTARSCPGVWSFQLAARAAGHRLGVDHVPPRARSGDRRTARHPPTVTQVCLLAVGYYTGDTFTPAPRRRRGRSRT